MKLHEQVKMQKELIECYRAGIRDLQRYLRLEKFNRPDNYVNTSDIFLRLDELEQNIKEIPNTYPL